MVTKWSFTLYNSIKYQTNDILISQTRYEKDYIRENKLIYVLKNQILSKLVYKKLQRQIPTTIEFLSSTLQDSHGVIVSFDVCSRGKSDIWNCIMTFI